MKKDNRKQYLQTWQHYLKGKKEINFKELLTLLGKKFKASYASNTLKRYNAIVVSNLFENGYLTGKKSGGFTAGPLAIAKKITIPVLDKCLTRNFKKVRFAQKDLVPILKKRAALKPKKVQKKIARTAKRKIRAVKIRKKILKTKKVKVPVRRVRKKEMIQTGQTTFYYAQQLTKQIAELERRLSAYEHVFENLRGLFGREIHEMERWLEKFFR